MFANNSKNIKSKVYCINISYYLPMQTFRAIQGTRMTPHLLGETWEQRRQ